MPTALTAATSREDLIEGVIHLAALVPSTGMLPWNELRAPLGRLSVLTARYLNTLRLDDEAAEQQHAELDTTAKQLLTLGVQLGHLALDDAAWMNRPLMVACAAARRAANAYLTEQRRQHEL